MYMKKTEKENIVGRNIDKINYHLWGCYGSFLYDLHEDLKFNRKKYNELLSSIKILKKNKISPSSVWDCFIVNLFKITYMYDILRDYYVHKNSLNISIDDYYEFILELKYEIEALFYDDIKEDYHENKY